MAFKAGFVMMSPDGDPTKHRASIKTEKLEVTMIIIEFMNFDQAVAVCRDLAQKEGVQSLFLCPSFHHEAVARIVNAVGPGVAVAVARGDIPSGMKSFVRLGPEKYSPLPI
jgi:hypothetical protein